VKVVTVKMVMKMIWACAKLVMEVKKTGLQEAGEKNRRIGRLTPPYNRL